MTRSGSAFEGAITKREYLSIGTAVLTDAELGQLQQFLDADAGVAQGLDDGPLHRTPWCCLLEIGMASSRHAPR